MRRGWRAFSGVFAAVLAGSLPGAVADDGEAERRFTPKGLGVHIKEVRSSDGSAPPAYVDVSGKGAILCHLTIYHHAHSFLRGCPDAVTPQYRAEVDRTIARYEAFVIQNSSRPVEIGRPEDLVPDGTYACDGRDGEIFRHMLQGTPEELRAQVDEVLSIPREPVMAPCL